MNIGIVVFHSDGPQVFLDCPTWRLKALHPDLEYLDLAQWSTELEDVLNEFSDQRSQLDWLSKGMGSIYADRALGYLHAEGQEAISSAVEGILERYVHPPERSVSPGARGGPISKPGLQTQLKSWFRASKVFSSRVSDLANRRIIPGYPIDVSDDLYADFALKNGDIHIIEALDLRGVDKVTKAVRGEAGMTAILLDQAKYHLPPNSKRIAVTASDNYSAVKSVVHLVGRYADDVIAIEDPSDRQRLAEFIAESLEDKEPLLPRILETQPEFVFGS